VEKEKGKKKLKAMAAFFVEAMIGGGGKRAKKRRRGGVETVLFLSQLLPMKNKEWKKGKRKKEKARRHIIDRYFYRFTFLECHAKRKKKKKKRGERETRRFIVGVISAVGRKGREEEGRGRN